MNYTTENISIDDQCVIQRTLFENNTVVLSESVSYLNTFNINLTFITGSKDEKQDEYGICHLIEHLVFKNGLTEPGINILKKIEDKAGEINAYTGKEETSFEMTCLYSDYEYLLPLMFDLVFNFNFTDDQFDKEKEIIIHENAEDNNDYELVIDELIFKNCLPDDVGHSIGGDDSTLRKMTRSKVENYYKEKFRFDNLIITICGKQANLDVLKCIDSLLSKYKLISNNEPFRLTESKSSLLYKDVNLNKNLESVVLNFVTEGPTALSSERFAYSILNQYLCDGMSSVLFDILREKEGLIYSILSSLDTFYNSGLYIINTSTNKKSVEKVKGHIKAELEKISKTGIQASRLELEKDKLIRAYLMGFDDALTRSSFFTNCEKYKKSFSFNELKTNLLKVTNQDIISIVNNKILKNNCFYICD